MDERQEYLTKEKYSELEEELQQLKSERRKEIAEQLEYAKSLGDLSENAEYHQAREDQAKTEDRIKNLEMILKHAVIVSSHHSDVVEVGSTVRVKKKGDKDERVLQIVGTEEADMSEGKISNKSPIGSALMGKQKGDAVDVDTPGGKAHYEIIEIE